MIKGLSLNQIYLVTGITDMRKAINGLSLIVSEQLGHDPFCGSIFVFCNRGKNKLKILYWEHNGFWLYYKRLEKGQFKWPQTKNDALSLLLSSRQLQWLLDGLPCHQPQAHQGLKGLQNN